MQREIALAEEEALRKKQEAAKRRKNNMVGLRASR